MAVCLIFYLALVYFILQGALAQDCKYSFDNFTCTCTDLTISCSGNQDIRSELMSVISNISATHFELSELGIVSVTLNQLNFSSNLSFVNASFKNLKLGYGLEKLNDGFFDALNDFLIYLDLRNNSFKHVPSNALHVLLNLNKLDLSQNKIASLSELDLRGLHNLKILNLEHNEIAVLSNPFVAVKNLEVLNLDFNYLKTIKPSEFVELEHLKHVSLSTNLLNEILPGTFDNLKSLYELDISGNVILSFTRIQIASASIEKLFARNCSLQGILTRETMKDLTRLRQLDLSDNHIQEIRANALSKLVQLQVLNLNNNEIATVRDEALSSLHQLVELDLSHNNLSALEKHAFKSLTQLETLNLNGNKLKTISCGLTSDMYSLETLELEDNKIQTIHPGTFAASINLTTLKLEGNSFDCRTTCPATYLADYLRKSTSISPIDAESAKCHIPTDRYGISIINIQFEIIPCPDVSQSKAKKCPMETEYEDYSDVVTDLAVTTSANDSKAKLIFMSQSSVKDSSSSVPNNKQSTTSLGIKPITSTSTLTRKPFTVNSTRMFAKGSTIGTIDSRSPFNFTYFNIVILNTTVVKVDWKVNRKESSSYVCHLELTVTKGNMSHINESFPCLDNIYITNMMVNTRYNFCMTSYHISYGVNQICYEIYYPLGSKLKSKNTSKSFFILVGLLVVVLCAVLMLISRRMFKKYHHGERYIVSQEDNEIDKRHNHTTQSQQSSFRCSYKVNEMS